MESLIYSPHFGRLVVTNKIISNLSITLLQPFQILLLDYPEQEVILDKSKSNLFKLILNNSRNIPFQGLQM